MYKKIETKIPHLSQNSQQNKAQPTEQIRTFVANMRTMRVRNKHLNSLNDES